MDKGTEEAWRVLLVAQDASQVIDLTDALCARGYAVVGPASNADVARDPALLDVRAACIISPSGPNSSGWSDSWTLARTLGARGVSVVFLSDETRYADLGGELIHVADKMTPVSRWLDALGRDRAARG